MKQDVQLSIIDRQTKRTIAGRAFPSGIDRRNAVRYTAAVATPSGVSHWAEITIAGDDDVRVVASEKRFGARPVHEGRYRIEHGSALIAYPIDERWSAIVEIVPARPRQMPPAKPKTSRATPRTTPVREGYWRRLLRVFGFVPLTRTREPIVRELDERRIARVRQS